MPAFDCELTPTRAMGAIVECFRHLDGTKRSAHPCLSFTAYGPFAEEIVRVHEVGHGFDDASPLGRLYDMNAKVLLLGVDHDNNTSLHLAETRADIVKQVQRRGAPMLVGGVREWVTYEEQLEDSSDFAQLGRDFAETGNQQEGLIGHSRSKLMSQLSVVDFATTWFETHRQRS